MLAGLDVEAGETVDGGGWAGWQALERTAQSERVAAAEGDGRYACDVSSSVLRVPLHPLKLTVSSGHPRMVSTPHLANRKGKASHSGSCVCLLQRVSALLLLPP